MRHSTICARCDCDLPTKDEQLRSVCNGCSEKIAEIEDFEARWVAKGMPDGINADAWKSMLAASVGSLLSLGIDKDLLADYVYDVVEHVGMYRKEPPALPENSSPASVGDGRVAGWRIGLGRSPKE